MTGHRQRRCTHLPLTAGFSGDEDVLASFPFELTADDSNDNHSDNRRTSRAHHPDTGMNTRRRFLSSSLSVAGAVIAAASATDAAPPIAVIAEELGYFPVVNRDGKTVYVPQRVKRASSPQAVRLAEKLRSEGVAMVGTYWCPHTGRQKELFGREAMAIVRYVECSPKGYGANPGFCLAKQVDGYPAWLFPGGEVLSGERSLSELARRVGYDGFDESLEANVPPMIGMGACKQ